MTILNLRDPGLSWSNVPIAGADQPAQALVLHAEPDLSARLVAVRFPAGWSRPGTGRQPSAEEMVVLDGSFTMNGRAYGAGTLLVVPPEATRAATTSAEGCLAVVWIVGPSGWAPGAAADAPPVGVQRLEPGLVRTDGQGLPGSSRVLAEAGPGDDPAPVTTDVLSLTTAEWAVAAAGESLPHLEPPVMLRRWR